jgi:PAS domain S-box-containing protein
MSQDGFGGWEPAFYAVFERTSNPMVLLDGERVIVDANQAIADLLGYRRDEMIGRSMLDFIPAAEHEHHRVAWAQLQAVGEQTVDRTLLTRDGRQVPVQYAGTLTEVPDHGALGVYVAIEVGSAPEREEDDVPAAQHPPLTARESEVVRLVALGKTGTDIAADLHLSPETVRTHVRNAMAKTGTRTRAQLVATAFSDRLIA